jgi:hypothetical protein
MVVEPAATPVNTPDTELIVATEVLLLDQDPPVAPVTNVGGASLRHTTVGPMIGGRAFTEMAAEPRHPPDMT